MLNISSKNPLLRVRGFVFCLCTLLLFFSGCSSKHWRVQADKAAENIIKRAQQDALGRTEPFTIETPAQTLRRKLILEQDLPYAVKASLGSGDLEPIEHWPQDDYLEQKHKNNTLDYVPDTAFTSQTLFITLTDALKISAHNSRDFQSRKESVFRTALALDLEDDEFRSTFAGTWRTIFSSNWTDEDNGNGYHLEALEHRGTLGWSKKFRTGLEFTTSVALDLVELLSNEGQFSRGIVLDSTISMPLLRGAGWHIVSEPLTQAERNVLYAIYEFERYKRTFAVDVASSYLGVVRQMDEVRNAEDNYRRLIAAGRRARRMADAGRLPEIQVDQASQDELRARNRWIAARQNFAERLDSLKIRLGLPTDSFIELDHKEMNRMAERSTQLLEKMDDDNSEKVYTTLGDFIPADSPVDLKEPDPKDAGPLELDEKEAVKIALENRLDLRTIAAKVYDAQRKVIVAANGLLTQADLQGSGTWGASRSSGSATSPDANITMDEGDYTARIDLDLPFERTRERNQYRQSLINLEESVRSLQNLEDQVKLQVRGNLRSLLESRESVRIQSKAVYLAKRRVDSTNLFLEAGRAEIRDLLDAQEDLVSARNSLTSALINYRIAELELQQNMGVLQVGASGLWTEYIPESPKLEEKINQNSKRSFE